MQRKFLGRLSIYLLAPFALILTLYLIGLILYDGPFGEPLSIGNILLTLTWFGSFLYLFCKLKRFAFRILLTIAFTAIVLLPWFTIQPKAEANWKPEFAQTGHVEIEGDTLTFQNIRDFRYQPNGAVKEERWLTKTYQLSNLQGLDYFQDAFGGEYIAHPLVSFDFGPQGHLVLSIETRREQDESFSLFGGIYKMFELQYIFGTEADLFYLRTNVGKNPSYLYRTQATPAQAKELLLQSINSQNRLAKEPRFYNLITHNCTTSLRAQKPAEDRGPLDYRLLLNGKLDELLYDKDLLHTADLTFPELRRESYITDKAQEIQDQASYSQHIRQKLTTFTQ